jgi:ceramide glucosyltransferase
MVSILLAVLAFLSVAITLWQWRVARAFPLHTKNPVHSFARPVTILKPLRGSEPNTTACLESWLTQVYPANIEVLFGVASEHDPVCKVVRKLLQAHPTVRAQLIICPAILGTNGKVSTLVQLSHHAKHEVIIVSDADVLVAPDFVSKFVAPLEDPSIGLVNSFYSLANPSTVAMQWETIAINSDFWSKVLQSKSLRPIDFSLGAVMATRRTDLAGIGGFETLVDFLADDYQLGHRISRQGKRIALLGMVAECWSRQMGWREVWKHQLRWARTIRVCQPAGYFLTLFTNVTVWPAAWACSARSSAVWGASAACLLLRLVMTYDNQFRLTRSHKHWRYLWLAPITDLLNVLLWMAAFAGNIVEWRGVRYRVQRNGKLIPTGQRA